MTDHAPKRRAVEAPALNEDEIYERPKTFAQFMRSFENHLKTRPIAVTPKWTLQDDFFLGTKNLSF